MENEFSVKRILGVAGAVVGAILLVVVLFRSFAVVSNGHVGVVSVFGNIKKEPFSSGLHFKAFWVSVYQVNNQLQPFHDKAAGASKDLQVVSTEITVQYSLVGAMAPEMYKNVGVDVKTELEPAILRPAIQESVKAVTARYSAEELITQRQKVKVEVEDAIKDFIATTLKNKNSAGAIDIGNVAITDFSFSQKFNDSIEAKVKSGQGAQQAVNDAKKTVTNAEAKAEAVKRAADAEAFNIKQNAIARAKAIELEGEQLRKNPEILKLRATERWDGKVPTYLGGSQTVPFIGDALHQGNPPATELPK